MASGRLTWTEMFRLAANAEGVPGTMTRAAIVIELVGGQNDDGLKVYCRFGDAHV